jgi:endonuclease I
MGMLCLFSFACAQGPNGSGTYYQAADGQKGFGLKTALFNIIKNPEVVGYGDLWQAYKETDVTANGHIWDMYSNITYYVPGGIYQGANITGKEGESYNREHSFPKSWFESQTPMYSDIVHVIPTDGYVNGKRSNYPFGETTGNSYKSKNDFSKLGTCIYPGYTGMVFEPNDIYKGDFARTYFYMVTCYEEKLPDWYTNYGVGGSGDTKEGVMATLDGNTYPGLSTWQLEMLMKWSKNDPVSADKETPRNNAVYTIQNNRNPFIDYPGLEEYIWGSMKDVAFSYDHYQMPTAIITTQAERSTKDGVMYNLAGQVVDKSYKGIVIMNGKKFMNK